MIINLVLHIKYIVLVVHVTLEKPNVMQKLDGMNVIFQQPSKHLRSNINHCSTRTVISNAPTNIEIRKNLETSYIALRKPYLNKEKDFERLALFRNGVR